MRNDLSTGGYLVSMEQILVCEEGDWSLRQSFRDPVLVEDDRVLENLLATEDHYTLSSSYFRFQEDIQPYMRKTVAKWMLEVIDQTMNNSLYILIAKFNFYSARKSQIAGSNLFTGSYLKKMIVRRSRESRRYTQLGD